MLFGGDTTETCLCNTEAYIHQWQHLWHYLHGQTPLEVSGKISLSPVRANFSSHSGCMQKMQPFRRLSGFILTTIFHLITVTHHASPPCWQLPWQPTRCLCCSLRKKTLRGDKFDGRDVYAHYGSQIGFHGRFFQSVKVEDLSLLHWCLWDRLIHDWFLRLRSGNEQPVSKTRVVNLIWNGNNQRASWELVDPADHQELKTHLFRWKVRYLFIVCSVMWACPQTWTRHGLPTAVSECHREAAAGFRQVNSQLCFLSSTSVSWCISNIPT